MINGTSLLLSSVPARTRVLRVAATASGISRSRKSFSTSVRKSVRYASTMSSVEVCTEKLGDCKKKEASRISLASVDEKERT